VLETEKLMPLVQAVESATGRRVHLSTVLRWTMRGSKGLTLESVFLGGRRLTSVESVRRFIQAGSERAKATTTPQITPRQAAAIAERDAKRLAKRLA
jgi:hypothetical protein